MVFFNEFGVEIIPESSDFDKFTRNGSKYIGLDNGTDYKIKLINNRAVPADAKVEVDGKEVGSWRIHQNSSIVVERPANLHKKFTFFSKFSMEAIDAGAITEESTDGLIKVTFYPKRQVKYETLPVRSMMAPYAALAKTATRYSPGITLYGKESQQRFSRTEPITDVDTRNITTIYLRLVVRETKSNKYPKPL